MSDRNKNILNINSIVLSISVMGMIVSYIFSPDHIAISSRGNWYDTLGVISVCTMLMSLIVYMILPLLLVEDSSKEP